VHRNGPGLKKLGNAKSERWYGPGYCGICGNREVVPVAVRYWDPDDGWRMGVLCEGCGADCTDRGPKPDDFAVHVEELKKEGLNARIAGNGIDAQALRIDMMAQLTDLDGAYADLSDMDAMDDYANGDI
jgi:hypothetical protein